MKLTCENLRIDGKKPGEVIAFGIDHELATVKYIVKVKGKEQERTITVPTESISFVR